MLRKYIWEIVLVVGIAGLLIALLSILSAFNTHVASSREAAIHVPLTPLDQFKPAPSDLSVAVPSDAGDNRFALGNQPRPEVQVTTEVSWPQYPKPALTRVDSPDKPHGTARLAGIVKDGRGVAVVGAWVSLWTLSERVDGDQGEREVGREETQAGGRFVFENLAVGRYVLKTRAMHAIDTQPKGLIVSAPNENVELRVDRFGQVAGVVWSEMHGREVEAFTVVVMPHDPNRPLEPPAEVLSGSDVIPDPLDPRPTLARYRFQARGGRFACYTGIGRFVVTVVAAPHPGEPVSVLMPVSIAVETPAHELLNLSFMLGRQAVIAGRVMELQTGRPVAHAVISAVLESGGDEVAFTKSDARGAFRLLLPRGGAFVLRAVPIRHAPATARVAVLDGETKSVQMEVDSGVVLKGRAVDPDDKPVPGVSLVVAIVPGDRKTERLAMRGGTILTDERGEFWLPGLTAGEYWIGTDWRDGWLPSVPTTVHVPAGGATHVVRLVRGATVKVRLDARGAAIGPGGQLVLRRAKDSPLPESLVKPGASRMAEPPMGEYGPMELNDPTGLAIVRGLIPGRYDLEFSHPEFREVRQHHEFAQPNTEYAVTVIVEKGGELSGRVVDERGQPLGGATVTCQPVRGGGSARHAASDIQGNFRVAGLALGDHRFSIGKRGFLSRIEIVPITAQPTTRDFTLELGVTVQGRMFDHQGRPVAQGTVRFESDLSNPESAASVVVVNGDFQVAGLRAGRYTVTAAAQGYSTEITTVEIRGPIHTLDLTLRRGNTLQGRVRDGAGMAISQAKVWLEGMAGKELATAFTATDGRFALIGFETGTYTLRATAEGFAPWSDEVVLTATMPVIDITLTTGVTLSGTLKMAADAQAAWVITVRRDPSECEWIGAQAPMPLAMVAADTGRFRLGGLTQGRWQVHVLDARTHALIKRVDTVLTQDTDLTLECAEVPRFAVTGQVVDAARKPMANVYLTLESAENPHFRPTVPTDATGKFQFTGVPSGKYDIVGVSALNYPLTPTWSVEVANGDATVALTAISVVNGIRLAAVLRGGLAEQLGLRPGDILFLYDGQPVRGMTELAHRIKVAVERGADRVELKFWRTGDSKPSAVHPRPGDLRIRPR